MEFIKEFLTPNQRFYKTSHTDIYYLTETLDRVFRRFLGAHEPLTEEMVINAFHLNGFKIKEFPSEFRLKDDKMEPMLYVGVLAKEVVPLRAILGVLPERTSAETRAQYTHLERRLAIFRKNLSLNSI